MTLSYQRGLRTMLGLALLCGITGGMAVWPMVLPAWSNPPSKRPRVVPPSTGKPPSVPAIRRNDQCSVKAPAVILPVTAKSQIETTAAYPTFLFFVPKTQATQIEFVLKADRKRVYRQTLPITKPGIVRLAVPSDGTVPALTVGQSYQWSFSLVCDQEDRSGDDYLVGKLVRSPLTSKQEAELAKATSLAQKLAFYQSAGLGYDAAVTLDAMRREKPNDKTIQANWETWLDKSELSDLKQEPVL